MTPSTLPRLRARAAGAGLAFALLAVTAALAGCGLFEPRDPETPTTPSTRCRTRSAADSVIAIVQENYGAASGVGCYASGLDVTFAFHPDPADSIDDPDPTIYVGWNKEVETRVTTNLAADAQFAQAVFDSEYAARDVSNDQRTETRHYAYHVLFQSKTLGTQTRFQGLADITLQQGPDALWTITTWVDKRDASSSPTWGRLRRNYRTGF